jgi:putative iron-dependent peroxidase
VSEPQPGILAEPPPLARYLVFQQRLGVSADESLRALAADEGGDSRVIGLGASLVASLGAEIPGLRAFPVYEGPGVNVPSTPAALWCWLRGSDRGELVHQTRSLTELLEDAFECVDVIDAFCYGEGRDLSGYIDGTENPTGKRAREVGIAAGGGSGTDASAFVSVQQWVHDLDVFDAMTQAERDDAIGRRLSDNEELEDAPESAHVKRSAQENFEPEAFLLRRSMPYAQAETYGLLFVAFGASLDPFEAQLRRMVGAEDGIVDALFGFTQPVTGNHFWCPPSSGAGLDLSALGL